MVSIMVSTQEKAAFRRGNPSSTYNRGEKGGKRRREKKEDLEMKMTMMIMVMGMNAA